MSGHSDLAEEMRLLTESVLERIEPMLRRTAAGEGKPEWDGCSACPICALTAVLRGEQHELLTSLADHGTAMVVILREALAGMPVDPLLPPEADVPKTTQPEPAPDVPGPTADVSSSHPVVDSAPATDIATHRTRRGASKMRRRHPAAAAADSRFVQIPVTIKT